MRNKTIANIGPETLKSVLSKLIEIKAELPFLVSLTVKERRRGQNFGRLAPGYGKAVSQSSKVHAQVVPRQFEVEEFDQQIVIHDILQIIELEFKSFTQTITDTRIATHHYIVQQSNDVYAALKRAAMHESKYQSAVEELGTFYKRGRGKKNTSTQENE